MMKANVPSTPRATSTIQGSQPPKKQSLLVKILLRVAVIVPLVVLLRFTGIVESLAFYLPSRDAFTTPAGIQDVTIDAGDGKQLHAWFIPATDAGVGEKRPAILHVHGNAGNVSHHLAFSQHLADAGFHVFLFDYRGFGRSTPARFLSRQQLMSDTRAAWDAMLARPDVDAQRSGVYGVSLGGAFALALASERPNQVKALCTVSAFSGFADIASDKVPVVGRLLVSNSLAGTQSAPSVRCPYLIVHGSNDEVIPVSHAAVLEAAANAGTSSQEATGNQTTPKQRVRRIIINGADHNGIMDGDIAKRETSEFFADILK
jgi:pimeloyl-ACP methyl ester carboxylesterase